MNVMDRILGRKPRSPVTIRASLDAARLALSEAQARAAGAAERRATAITNGDRSGAIAADAERSAAGIDAEIAGDEIAGLEAGLAEAVRADETAKRAAVIAALVERRAALAHRFESDWKRAADIMAGIMGEARTLARDLAEAGAEHEVDRLPEIARGLPCIESTATISAWLVDALASKPDVPESAKERTSREHDERRKRDRAKAEEDRRAKAAAEAEEGRAVREAERRAEAERERNPYYPTWRDHMDATR